MAYDTVVDLQTTLTDAGSTRSRAMSKRASFFYKVAAIGTNVVVKIEASANGTDWATIVPTSSLTTVTAGAVTHTSNGTYCIQVEGAYPYVRFTWVSKSGGSPTIQVSIAVQ